MKIKIIGTGSMWAKFNSASYLIDDEILIDVPNGTCKNLFRMNLSPQKIRYVLITHFHGDHYFDMPFLFLLKAKATEKNLDIFCSEEGELKIQDLLKMAFPNSVEGVNKDIKLNYNFASTFKIGEYSITKYLVDHGKMKPVYGYIIETEEIKNRFYGRHNIM